MRPGRADEGIRTRDPHLGKVPGTVQGCPPVFVFAGHGSPTPWRPYANGDESARIDKHRTRNRARWAPGEIRHVLCLPTGLGRGRHPGSCESKTLPGLQPISAGSLPTTRRVSKRRALMTTADTPWSSSASLSPEVHLPAPPVERAPASLVIARRTARRGCPPSQRSDGGRGGGAPAVRRGSPEWGMGPEIRAPARPRQLDLGYRSVLAGV